VRGLHEYGREDVKSGERIRTRWTYEGGKQGAQARSWCARQFWETLHIDLRMVDTSDFSISYCPTNIYSVGTPHEIIMATLQHKPVLFVSPPIVFPTLHGLRAHLKNDPAGSEMLKRLEAEIPIKENRACGISRWSVARTSSTVLVLPRIGNGSAGGRKSPLTSTKRDSPRNAHCCRLWKSSTRACRKSGIANSTVSCPTTTGCCGISTQSRFAVNTLSRLASSLIQIGTAAGGRTVSVGAGQISSALIPPVFHPGGDLRRLRFAARLDVENVRAAFAIVVEQRSRPFLVNDQFAGDQCFRIILALRARPCGKAAKRVTAARLTVFTSLTRGRSTSH
jgi:hypothetical protein